MSATPTITALTARLSNERWRLAAAQTDAGKLILTSYVAQIEREIRSMNTDDRAPFRDQAARLDDAVDCPACDGNGEIDEEECPLCGGDGEVTLQAADNYRPAAVVEISTEEDDDELLECERDVRDAIDSGDWTPSPRQRSMPAVIEYERKHGPIKH